MRCMPRKLVKPMNKRRKVRMKNGRGGYLIGIFQYGSLMDEHGTEPLAVIEMADGSIEDAVSLTSFHFVVEVDPNATTHN